MKKFKIEQKLTFFKAQFASLSATVLDFSLVFILTEIFHFHYTKSVACGALAGAILNFSLGRIWAFKSSHNPVGREIFKYALVSMSSLFLNVFGVRFFTETFGIHYGVSKVITALSVGLFFNYPLQKYFVFR